MIEEDNLLIERPMRAHDTDFVFSSWLRSYRLVPGVKQLEKTVYFEGQERVISKILARSSTKMLVSASDPDTVIAWMTYQNHWIHYLYVKKEFRRMQLANRLVGDLGRWKGYTHRFLLQQKLSLPPSLVYDPYKAWLS